MKILLLSDDNYLIDILKEPEEKSLDQIIILSGISEPLSVISSVCRIKPKILLMDDDLLKPNTAHILKFVKELLCAMHVIFITSDTGLELGREISQIGIQYYAIKPVKKDDLKDALYSIHLLQNKQLTRV